MKKIIALYKALTIRFFRDKTALFFTVVLPVLFLLVFGGIFGNQDNFRPRITFDNRSTSEFAQQFIEQAKDGSLFEVVETPADLREEKLSRAEIDVVVVLEEDFGAITQLSEEARGPSGTLRIQYPASRQSDAQIIVNVLRQVINEMNQGILPYSPPIAVIDDPQSISEFSNFDYTFSGLIAFSLMSLGVFGMANGFVGDKKSGAIDRLRSAPIQAYHLIIATALNYISLAFVSIAVMLVVAVSLFDFNMQGDWPSFIALIILGTVTMFGLGFAIAGWARDEKQSAPVSNIIAFPMMFLSGVFFPTFLMPDWLQSVSKWLPLYPIADSLRLVLMEGKTLFDLPASLAAIVGWAILFYVVAFKVFRWR